MNPSSIQNESTRTSVHESPETSLVPRIIAGSVGSIITALAVTPLEVVKVRQQASLGAPFTFAASRANQNARHIASISTAAATATTSAMKRCPDCGIFFLNNGLMECVLPKRSVPHFQPAWTSNAVMNEASVSSVMNDHNQGTFRLLRSIFRKEGLSGIYAGLSPTLVMSVPNTVLYFTAYDELSSRLHQFSKQRQFSSVVFDNVFNPLICGSTARLLATVVTSPLELIRTRQASRIASSTTASAIQTSSLMNELQTIIRTEGIYSLFKGLGPTLYRDVPFSAIYWLCLEQFKSILRQRSQIDSQPLSPIMASSHAFASGALAGMIAAFCTTPFDVLKTRQQMELLQQVANEKNSVKAELPNFSRVGCNHHSIPSHSNVVKGNNIWAQLHEIASTEGVQGLWRGNQTRMIKVAPACAIMISCYEFGKRTLDF